VSEETRWREQVEAFLVNYDGLTRRRYADALADFHRWYVGTYGEEPDARLLTREEAREYRAYLSGTRGLKASTVNGRLAALRSLVRFHGRTLRVRGVRRVEAPVEALTGRELGRLLAVLEGPRWLDKRNVALVSLMARAGLRVSEALGLRMGDVELNARSGSVLVRRGKGLKERRVPLSAEARRALREYLEVRPEARTDMLFLSRTLEPLKARDVQRLIAEAARRAGLRKRVTPHVLRHTFATRFLRQGGDLATLQAVLGHANLATTARYLHPDAARVQEMVEEM